MFNFLLSQFAAVGGPCKPDAGGAFLGFPHWYQYLSGIQALSDPANNSSALICNPGITSLNDVWLIVAAVIEILLRVAAIVAVIFVIYGGVQYVISRAEPDKTNQARHTIINALVGLSIAVLAAVIVNFIAGNIH